MPALDPQLRRRLETAIAGSGTDAITGARAIAEAGARAALEALAVHEAEPYSHIKSKPELTALRNRLRAHARQLGDMQNSKGEITINALVHECAYEHWHRMLFARFLAENHLLIDPQARVAVTLEECEDLAKEEKTNKWEIAGRFAQAMLPQIFRADDPLLKVSLPADRRVQLETILADLPAPVFQADDSLGWVYQFWQSRRKDEVNDSGDKITGETLPSVTQLFTEHYMVLFLLHNTIGAWHAGKVLASSPSLAQSANSEDDLRRAVALKVGANGGYSFEYLRFVKDCGGWRPAAGVFTGWPKAASDLKVLDPCCGSGHFVVAAFELLVRLRMEEEGLPIADAVDSVIRENLFGLEIDQRCAHITAFNLALAAWKKAGYRSSQPLPPLNIACTGIAAAGTREQWMQMIAQQGTHDLRFFFGQLHDLFRKAATLGSLINPNRFFGSGMLGKDGMQTLMKALAAAIAEDPRATPERQELGVAAQGLAKAAELLAGPKGSGSPSGGGYTLVVTNVPYLGRGKQDDILREHLESQYPLGKSDLATAFVLRCLEFCASGGSTALVTPQNWLFLTSYTQMRKTLLERRTWNLVARLGPGAFETIGGHVVNVALLEITAREPTEEEIMAGIDASAARAPSEKAAVLRGDGVGSQAVRSDAVSGAGNSVIPAFGQSRRASNSLFGGTNGTNEGVGEASEDASERADAADAEESFRDGVTADGTVVLVPQAEQLKNPESRVTLNATSSDSLLEEVARAYQGMTTGDFPQFGRCLWEIMDVSGDWRFFQTTVEVGSAYAGRHQIVFWEDGRGRMKPLSQDPSRGSLAWSRPGVVVNQMGQLPVTLFGGDCYDNNACVISPFEPLHTSAIWCFCSSPDFVRSIRAIDQSIKVTNGTLLKVPFDLAHWQTVAAEKYPNGLPEPQSNDPTQWLFHGHPAGMVAAGPANGSPLSIADPVGTDRHQSLICRTPNLDAVLQVAVARLVGYRWPAEFDGKLRLDLASRAWVEKCKNLDHFADDDGVVPLVPMRGEPAAEGRVRDLLRSAFGGDWSGAKEATLLTAAAEANGDKSPAANLDEWLKNRFFSEHSALFQQRPFVWHIWDGRKKDGFGVLVHYHRLCAAGGGGRRLLESITHGYLGDWIARQRDEMKADKSGADARLAAALDLQKNLEAILKGEPPYDIFVRWKPLHEQPIGWEPDINDGVRMNIRPFIEAGVLRDRVNVKWTKDRGKEPEKLRRKAEFPWFWDGDTFIGDRVNDIHLKTSEKQKARDHAKKK